MNRALWIIGVPAVGVAAFYAGILWGRWGATLVAIGVSLLFAAAALFDRRRRRAGGAHPAGRG
jgi:hypothetical protein